jgi:hypothetical protein
MPERGRKKLERVVAEGRALQRHIPWLDMVALGGTAAALHAHYGNSLDTDHFTLERETVGDLTIPTVEETLRIKAFLCTDRQAFRDYPGGPCG